MDRPHLHVCIATGQNLANLIPAIQLQAKEVVILETPEMRASAGNLKAALKARGIAVRRMPFDDATPESIVASAQQISLELGVAPLVLNATGGHKLMTLALTAEMEDLAGDNLHLLYCETRSNRLDWLKPSPVTEPMADVLKIEDILLAQGYRIRSRGDRDVRSSVNAQARESLTRRLGDEAGKLAGFFGLLNDLANKALGESDDPFQPKQSMSFIPGGRIAELLRQAQRLGLMQWDEDTQIVFTSPDAARYFCGGWLEEYVWIKLRGLRPTDWATNLEVETVDGKTPNELDAVVAHRNRLLVIECKTRRFGVDTAKDADYVYKLAQLARQIGGLMGRGLLLSARSVSDEVRLRAKESQLDVLAAEEVGNLAEYLKSWLGK